MTNYRIVQIGAELSSVIDHKNEPKYRRVRLSEYLKKKYGDRYLCIDPLKDIFKIPKLGSNNIIIFSRPILKQNMLTLLKKGNKLIYERTDNWKVCSDTYDERDLQHVNSVDIVTNSARYLYEESKKYNENSYFIPNGCKEYNYVDYNIQKYETKTAIYIGNHLNKVDCELIDSIAKRNPNWNIHFYSPEHHTFTSNNVIIKDYIDDETDLYKELRKCHIGLIPFIQGEWTNGMLPLKLLQYQNAHLPILYTNCPEAKYWDNTIEYSNQPLDDILQSKFNFDQYNGKLDWSITFEKICDVISKLSIT